MSQVRIRLGAPNLLLPNLRHAAQVCLVMVPGLGSLPVGRLFVLKLGRCPGPWATGAPGGRLPEAKVGLVMRALPANTARQELPKRDEPDPAMLEELAVGQRSVRTSRFAIPN